MYQLLLPAVILIGASVPVAAQTPSPDPAAKDSVTGPIKDREAKNAKLYGNGKTQPPGTSAPETAGARTPDASHRTTKGTNPPRD